MSKSNRQVVLDTETTGLSAAEDRIIEIGCIELVDRVRTGREYHQYINPKQKIAHGAYKVNGISNEFLENKPLFEDVMDDFMEFIAGSELIIHNAKFDVGFMDHEFSLINMANRGGQKVPMTGDICTVTDTLKVSKDEFGSPKTLDYLARFYKVDGLIDRTYHGALIDAQLLAFVYIEMTRKQSTLNLSAGDHNSSDANAIRRLSTTREKLKVIAASADEIDARQERLSIVKQKGGEPLWIQAN